jgi:hypothetical protein
VPINQSGRLNGADIARFFAFGTGRALERNALVFGKAFKTFRLNILEMGEQIAAACVRRNEAEAFGIVEPFHGAGLGSHLIILLNAWARRPERTYDQGSVTKEIKQERQQAGRERKANNNDDLMQCKKKDTGLFRVYLIISDLFFPAAVRELFGASGNGNCYHR